MSELLRFVFVFCLLMRALCAQDAAQLQVGHWARIKGKLESAGVFSASEIELSQPDGSAALTGTVERLLDDGGFTLLGVRVRVDKRTAFEGLDASALNGARIKVAGRPEEDGSFTARRIAIRDAGRDRLEGRIDAIERADDQVVLRVLGFAVRAKAQSKLELDLPLEQLRLAAPRTIADATPARDSDDLIRGSLRLSENLVLGGVLEYTGENRGNYDLDETRARDRLENQLSLKAELVWTPRNDMLFLASYEHTEDWRSEQGKPTDHSDDDQLKQAYGLFRDVAFGWDVQAGRAEYHEQRRWIYNADLDGVRFLKDWNGLKFDLSLSTRFSDASTRDEDTTNMMAYVSGGTPKRLWALWAIDRDNRELALDHSQHYGARLLGDWLPSLDVWVEGSLLRGDLQGKSVEGQAFDVGAVWTPGFLGPLSVIGGYAFASGDTTPLDGDSSTYRQTGFQDNKGKLDSATSLRYYGELVDPELANLGILTLGLGLHLEKRTTLSLIAHQYTLDQSQDAIYGSNLRATPDGVHPELGWELDLVLGTKRWKDWQVELVLGSFEPGAAFPGGENAYLGAVQIKYRF